ncbi:MAG: SRPBCC family protein, partial [Bacteroidales bacterium]|nr:SRPBCC family protein [Bacteroidales bacterium]
MKALLKLLYVLLAIMILVCLTGIFLPSQINIKSTIEIQALPNVVFDQVNTMERWEIWSPWKDVDSSMTYTFSGNRIGEGSVMNWTSSQSGNGKMKITNSENAKSIELALFFEEQGNAVVAWDFEPVANSTLCNWSFSKNNLSYIERYVMVLFQKQIQASMNRGLLNLKKYCEKIKHGRVGIVSEIGIPPRKMLIITDSVPQTEIVKKELEMNRLFAKYQEKKKVEIKEQPITIF